MEKGRFYPISLLIFIVQNDNAKLSTLIPPKLHNRCCFKQSLGTANRAYVGRNPNGVLSGMTLCLTPSIET